MATYKVLQDIEAEDKLLGPLTLRQCIYAAVVVLAGYLSFLGLSKGTRVVLVLLFPVMAFCGFLAWPWSRDQPTEIWLLAKIRFMVKPRKRIWDQSGLKELVTITVPKKQEKTYTNGLSQNEVKSRLRALADTIDSRGWAVKNVNVNLFAQPAMIAVQETDRLLDASSIPQEVPTIDIVPADDIMDTQNNHVAAQLDQMIHASSEAHRKELVDKVRAAAKANPNGTDAPNDYWFMNQPSPQAVPAGYATFSTQVVTPGSHDEPAGLPAVAADDPALAAQLHTKKDAPQIAYGHLKTIQPLSATPPQPVAQPMTAPADPAILGLANRDDLNVATIARQAEAAKAKEMPGDDEVVISLH